MPQKLHCIDLVYWNCGLSAKPTDQCHAKFSEGKLCLWINHFTNTRMKQNSSKGADWMARWIYNIKLSSSIVGLVHFKNTYTPPGNLQIVLTNAKYWYWILCPIFRWILWSEIEKLYSDGTRSSCTCDDLHAWLAGGITYTCSGQVVSPYTSPSKRGRQPTWYHAPSSFS